MPARLPSPPLRIVSSPRYAVDLGAHVFPTAKYAAVVQRLEQDGTLRPGALLEAPPAGEDLLLSVHTPAYLRRCRDGSLSPAEILRLELPWSPALYEASVRAVGGTLLAARLALEHGVGIHVGGGFHHAFPDHGEGFCVFNDTACTIRALQAEGLVRRALVVDCDVHQGNGTAAVFAGDPDVATFSLHQADIYPLERPPSTVDVELPAGTDDRTYLRRLEETFLPLLQRHLPELLVYLAGADPYRDDQLGGLALTLAGLRERDECVVEAARRLGLPLVVVLAGGYARRLADTVEIHHNTVVTAAALWR